MFPYLIQQRMEEPYFPLVFFDQGVKALKELGLSTLSNDRRSTYRNKASKPNPTTFESDIETPLFEHVGRANDKLAIFPLPVKPALRVPEDAFLKRRSDMEFDNAENGASRTNQLQSYQRAELSTDVDHQLADRSRGCLIIPGPIRRASYAELDEEDDDDERLSFVKFRYESGWPTLDPERLDAVASDLEEKGLCALKETRLRMVVQVSTVRNTCASHMANSICAV